MLIRRRERGDRNRLFPSLSSARPSRYHRPIDHTQLYRVRFNHSTRFAIFATCRRATRSGQSEILPEIQFRSDDSYGSRAIVTPVMSFVIPLPSPPPDSTIGGDGTVVETRRNTEANAR